jgi:hypothetical protein
VLSACGSNSEPVNLLDYYLLNKSAKGTLVSEQGTVYSTWQTAPLGANTGKINWGENELFAWDEQWLYLDGYHNVNYDIAYSQYATKQTVCIGSQCVLYQGLDRLKYAPIRPTDDYSIETIGYIVETTTGKKVQFKDVQRVKLNVPCSNPYYQHQLCIVQDEQWWDDNQTSFQLKYDRVTYFAKNLGIGFILEDRIANTKVYLR